jgi:hypothetical protein
MSRFKRIGKIVMYSVPITGGICGAIEGGYDSLHRYADPNETLLSRTNDFVSWTVIGAWNGAMYFTLFAAALPVVAITSIYKWTTTKNNKD